MKFEVYNFEVCNVCPMVTNEVRRMQNAENGWFGVSQGHSK